MSRETTIEFVLSDGMETTIRNAAWTAVNNAGYESEEDAAISSLYADGSTVTVTLYIDDESSYETQVAVHSSSTGVDFMRIGKQLWETFLEQASTEDDIHLDEWTVEYVEWDGFTCYLECADETRPVENHIEAEYE